MEQQMKKDIEIIMRQTNCLDVHLIKEKYIKYNGDIVEVVLNMLELNTATTEEKKNNVFEEFRDILAEKDKIYFANALKR